MVTYEYDGKIYTAEKIEQREGYFIAFNVTCEGVRFSRMLVREKK